MLKAFFGQPLGTLDGHSLSADRALAGREASGKSACWDGRCERSHRTKIIVLQESSFKSLSIIALIALIPLIALVANSSIS